MVLAVEIPDEQMTLLCEAVARRAGWTPTITTEGQEEPNPVTSLSVLRQRTLNFWHDELVAYQAGQTQSVPTTPELSVNITVQ